MKKQNSTPLSDFSWVKYVDADEADVDSNLDNQTRNTRQMVSHRLCTSYLVSANTNYSALLPTVNTAHATCIRCNT